MRPDLNIVADMVGHDASVLDLGCGDGALLDTLITRQNCSGLGVEREIEDFHACIARGVPVTHGDLEQELVETADDTFDYAVLSLTLQAVRNPDQVLTEMKRVARHQIVSLPNFGHWRLRTGLLLRGRMPSSPILPYPWYNTPNIRLCTLRDFESLVADLEIKIKRRVLIGADSRPAAARDRLAPNLLADGAVYLLER